MMNREEKDINILPGQHWDIEKAVDKAIRPKMDFSRWMPTIRRQRIGREDLGSYPKLDYETLFQVSFCLEDQVKIFRQMWMIGDDEETRPFHRLLQQTR